MLNIYAPCRDQHIFSDTLFDTEILDIEALMIARDLNVTLQANEVWETSRSYDPLGERLRQEYLSRNLVDIRPRKRMPTWDNKRMGVAFIAKRLDRFIVNSRIIDAWGMPLSFTDSDYTSDHRPIYLEWKELDHRLGYSFKFNRVNLEDQDFNDAIRKKWKEIKESDMALFTTFREKIQTIRVVTKEWQIRKKKKDKQALLDIQKKLCFLLNSSSTDCMTFERRNQIRELEKAKQVLLHEEEASWRLKSRALWLREGDRNSKYFHKYANARRSKNTIWHTEDGRGGLFYSQHDISVEASKFFQR